MASGLCLLIHPYAAVRSGHFQPRALETQRDMAPNVGQHPGFPRPSLCPAAGRRRTRRLLRPPAKPQGESQVLIVGTSTGFAVIAKIVLQKLLQK